MFSSIQSIPNLIFARSNVASNSRPSLLGLVQVANAYANSFPRLWGICIFLSELFRISSTKGHSVWFRGSKFSKLSDFYDVFFI